MMFYCNNQRNRCYRVSSSPFVPIEVRGSQFSLARQARDGGRLPGAIISDNQRWSEIAQDWTAVVKRKRPHAEAICAARALAPLRTPRRDYAGDPGPTNPTTAFR